MVHFPRPRSSFALALAIPALACAPRFASTGAPLAVPAASSAPAPAPEASTNAPAPAEAPPSVAVHHDPAKIDPSLATERAPAVFRARFVTTRGAFVVEVHRDWAPNGADRFYDLVKLGFFDDTRFFRVIDGFMVQFGISGDPGVSARWRHANIPDDPVVQSNRRGFVTFAQTSQPDSRSTQVFVNFGDNTRLDASRFAPFGQVVQGMHVVDSLYHGYGEGRPEGSGPDQSEIEERGNAYLDGEFPQLDRIVSAQVL